MPISAEQRKVKLERYYHLIQEIILSRQSPLTGLLPASTAVNSHGDYTDAWVRDNAYSILCVWGLALAYRKIDENQGRTSELEHSTIKLMRGLLFAMMRQADKVEQFKQNQSPPYSLHAKYDTDTGDTAVGDDEWGHLQLDATSIFLLILAQMTASGLQIVYTIDEVNFIQNLVYYIGRTYRTPDYGIWERGNKINKGNAELNASSVGMAKAALEALNGLNLFGVRGGQASVIHVLPDEIARARITLESLLPRESSSKETDAALLSIIGFPAFAVENVDLVRRTRDKIIDKLEGNYGCKRFLRDGHQTVLEDTDRLHYEPWELQEFEHIECEWPLFFTYLALDGICRRDTEQTENYLQKLSGLLVEKDGQKLLPELYYVPTVNIEAERQNPHSQQRLPNENVPLIWAQSLYWLVQLLQERLLEVGDIDPLGRYQRLGSDRQPVVQVALLAEDKNLQADLAAYGAIAQTPQEVEPIQIQRSRELAAAYTQIGRNDKLGLTGRPIRRLRSLTTSRIFRIRGETMVFLPSFLETEEFYLTFDYHFLVAQIKSELAYIHRSWSHLGRPTLVLLLTRKMLESGREAVLELAQELRQGRCGDTPVHLGRLQQLILTSGEEQFDELHEFAFPEVSLQEASSTKSYLLFDPAQTKPLTRTQEFGLECETDISCLLERLRQSANLYEQVQILQAMARLQGLQFDTGMGGPQLPVTVADLLDEIYFKAGQGVPQTSDFPASSLPFAPYWAVVRYAAGLLEKVDIRLSDAVTDILVRQKQIAVGKAYSDRSLITRPRSHLELLELICEFCSEDVRDRVLTQEILVYLSVLLKSDPKLFDGLLTLRVSYLILLLTSELAQEKKLTQDEAYEALMALSPFEVKTRLRQVLEGYASMNQLLKKQESLHLNQKSADIDWVIFPEETPQTPPQGGWLRHRELEGAAGRVPEDFYPQVWLLMKHCKGLVIGDKLERRNRIDSATILSEMTPGEKNFALQVEHLLNKIVAPAYRQVNIEALMELAAIAQRNPQLQVEEYLVLDIIIGHAVRLAWLERYPERESCYDNDKSMAWRSFYETSPHVCASYIAKAFQFLTELGKTTAA